MQRVRAIRFSRTGGPEVLTWEEVSVGSPAAGQVTVKHTAVGLNFIDAYHRTGLYPLQLPSGIGLEAAGVVEAVGEGVTEFAVGDRIAYGTGPIGAYSEARNIPADKIVKIPEGIEDRTAAAIMLKGLTAQYLLRRTYRVKAGDTILVHAAAGGVGLLLCQWAKHLGATVIGTVGSTAKGELARAHGCDHTILYRVTDVAKRVRELTGGAGVPVVYDGVGKDTFAASLDSLAPLGMMVSFGNASGPVGSIDPLIFSQKGSLFFTRPTLMHYTAKREDLLSMANELFEVVKSGAVKVEVNQSYRLFDAAHAHRDLESRKTTGSSVLTP
ncbi:MAG TPA: quinone oxidoreductase [Candidatus Acidoferrum sp.]|nr:quinone oxidoreductase [Candidatus Acidoferrum sp.]